MDSPSLSQIHQIENQDKWDDSVESCNICLESVEAAELLIKDANEMVTQSNKIKNIVNEFDVLTESLDSNCDICIESVEAAKRLIKDANEMVTQSNKIENIVNEFDVLTESLDSYCESKTRWPSFISWGSKYVSSKSNLSFLDQLSERDKLKINNKDNLVRDAELAAKGLVRTLKEVENLATEAKELAKKSEKNALEPGSDRYSKESQQSSKNLRLAVNNAKNIKDGELLKEINDAEKSSYQIDETYVSLDNLIKNLIGGALPWCTKSKGESFKNTESQHREVDIKQGDIKGSFENNFHSVYTYLSCDDKAVSQDFQTFNSSHTTNNSMLFTGAALGIGIGYTIGIFLMARKNK